MNDRLREAIAVARSGETREAQLLVAAILEHSPDNAQAWYLMSHLVESPARRAVYLYKTVSLDPYNERAKAELAQFPPTVTDTLANSINAAPLVDVASGDALPAIAAEPEPQNGIVNEVPEWLRPLAGDTPQRQPILATATGPELSPAAGYGSSTPLVKAKPAKRRQKRDGLLIAMVVALVVVTLVVLGLLAYLLLV